MCTKKSLFVFFLSVVCAIPGYGQGLNERIGVCSSVRETPLLKQAGCAHVEVGIRSFFVPDKADSVFALNLGDVMRSELPLYSGNSFFPGEFILVGPKADTKTILLYTETAMKRACQTNTSIFVLGSGTARMIPDGYSKERATKEFVRLCKKMAHLGKKYNITIVIEPLQQSETNFINTVRQGVEIVRAVNHPNLGVLADFFHMMRENEDPQALVEAGVWLKHCHIAEKEERTPPGVKGDDFTPYFRALKQINYKGSLSLECRWTDFKKEVFPAVAEVKRQISAVY